MNVTQKLVAILCCSSMFLACTSTTLIRSTNPSAKIYVDGELRGTGSVTHSDQKIVGTTTHVKLEQPGCRPETFSFSRSEEFDAGACVGGVFLLVPFLWIMKYKPERTFEYECRPEAGASVVQPRATGT
jgi:hypothetical protein